MIRAVLGYEKINNEVSIIDVLIRVNDGEIDIVEADLPIENFDISKSEFISIDKFRKEDRNHMVNIRPLKIKNDNREYIALGISDMKNNTVFRLIETENETNLYVVRLKFNRVAVNKRESSKIPDLYYNSEGRLEMEEKEYVYDYRTFVDVLVTTKYEGGNKENDEIIKEYLQDKFNFNKEERDIIQREVELCDIGLAVIKSVKSTEDIVGKGLE